MGRVGGKKKERVRNAVNGSKDLRKITTKEQNRNKKDRKREKIRGGKAGNERKWKM